MLRKPKKLASRAWSGRAPSEPQRCSLKKGLAMAQEQSFRDVQVRSSEIGIRTIGLNDLWQSLKEGYDDFNAMPTVGMLLAVLLYLLFALLLALFLVGGNLLHLAFPI